MANNGILHKIEEFLEKCKSSSQTAYDLLKEKLSEIESPQTQKDTRVFFYHLENYLKNTVTEENIMNTYFFSIDKLIIDGQEDSPHNLTLMQLPSIFTPEEWSFTFYEGLLRYSPDEFQGKTAAELGCGNGWISIALAKRQLPQKIYGLDINPKAIMCARINLYLNALDKNGDLKQDSEGLSLLDRVEFHVSDLLKFILDKKLLLDKVMGCIPQVLEPSANILSNFSLDQVSDQYLYSLSNYCEKQGVVEDEFGLGLIARATEESIHCLKSNGKLILNLGGRPGQSVLERLLTRRGFSIQTIWKTKIEQAMDTDVSSLVEIEHHSPHRFEFFLSAHSNQVINAKTAQAHAQKGGQIYHSLNVVEASLKENLKIKNIFSLLQNPSFVEVRNGLDLHFEHSFLQEEKVSFLSHLVHQFKNLSCFPYDDTKGTLSLRRKIGEYLRFYYKIPFTSKNVLIAPNRFYFIRNLIDIYGVKKALIDASLSKDLFLNTRDRDIYEVPGHILDFFYGSTCYLIEKYGLCARESRLQGLLLLPKDFAGQRSPQY